MARGGEAGAAAARARAEALRHRDFRLLFLGQTVSLVGDAAFVTALGSRTYTLAGAAKLGIVLVCQSGALLATLLVGALADRLSRRWAARRLRSRRRPRRRPLLPGVRRHGPARRRAAEHPVGDCADRRRPVEQPPARPGVRGAALRADRSGSAREPPVARRQPRLLRLVRVVPVGLAFAAGISGLAAPAALLAAGAELSACLIATALTRPSCARSTEELVGEPWFPDGESGCPDLNWGPLRPERSALPGCATPRADTD